ncbi:MAG: tetratricopeptide repeat protein [Armatimonadota bacterium]
MKTKKVSVAASALAVTGLAVLAPSVVPAWGGSQTPTQEAPPNPGAASVTAPSAASPTRTKTSTLLSDVIVAVREGRVEDGKRLLKSVKVSSLEPPEARRWRTMAVIVALRTGDSAWLSELTNDFQYYAKSIDLVTTTAAQLLRDGRREQARAVLASIKEPEKLDEVPHRRFLQILARLEQLDKNDKEERKYVNQLVSFASGWSNEVCQGCHANPSKQGEAVTTLNLSTLWFGERYVKLMQQQGDAATVLANAQKALSKNPSDSVARLKLAYALRATGKEAKAIETLRTFPWAEFPDRPKRPPLRFAIFP